MFAATALLAALAAPSLAISPPAIAQVVTPGSVQHVTVTDTGKGSEIVAMSASPVAKVNGVCRVQAGQVWGVRSSPARFTLHPGQSKVVDVAFATPTTAEEKAHTAPVGTEDLIVVASTSAGTKGNVRLDAGVGAQALVKYPGKTPLGAPKPCLSLTAPAPKGIDLWLVAGFIALLGAAACAVWLAVIFGRRAARKARRSS